MMSITDTNIQKLIINRLTQEKYDELLSSNQINDNELYITDTNDDSYSKPETDELLAQKADIQAVYTKDETDGFFTEIEDKINTITIPTNISELNNDIGYITNIPNEYITETELNDKGYLTEHQDITGKADITYLNERLELKSDKSDTYTKDEVNSLLENIEVSGGSLPNQIDNEGKFLSTNGSTAEWSSIGKFSDTIDSIDIDLNRVVINRLTQAQYDELSVNGQLKEDEIYVTDTVPYTKEEVDELLNGIGSPTKTSDLINDSDFITSEAVKNTTKMLDDEHKNILLSNGTYDGKDVEDGFVFTSPDGKLVGFDKTLNPGGDWYSVTLPTTNPSSSGGPYDGVCYGNGIFVAVNQYLRSSNSKTYSYVATSTNGKDWVEHTTALDWTPSSFTDTRSYFKVLFANGLFFMPDETNGSQRMAVSSDGQNWSEITINTYAPGVQDIVYFKGKYIMSNSLSNSIHISDNYTNWTQLSEPAGIAKCKLAASPNRIVAVKSDTFANQFYYSDNGVNWKSGTLLGNSYYQDIAYGKGKFVITTGTTSSARNTVLYSEDGVNWNASTMPSSGGWTNIIYDETADLFIAVNGTSDNVHLGKGAYSEDGINWTSFERPTGVINRYGLTSGNGVVVAVPTNPSGTSDLTPRIFHANYTPFYEYSLTDLSFNKAEAEENFALKSEIPPEIDTSKFLQNQAGESWTQSIGVGTPTDPAIINQYAATAFGSRAQVNGNQGVAYGVSAIANGEFSTSIGGLSNAQSRDSIAVGHMAVSTSPYSAQIGEGTNSNEGTFQFRNWTLVDANGNIPLERLSNIEISSGETLPDQTNNGGKVLTTNGDEASWNHIINLNDITTSSSEGLSNLVLNKLTQAEYNALLENNQINDNELYIITDTNNVFATKDELPTNISELNNDIGYITQDELSDQYVDTTTDQDISGLKTFLAEELVIRNNNMSFDTTPVSRLESRIVFKGSDGKPINNITCNRYPDGSTYVEFHIHAQNNAWSQPNTCLRFGHNGTRFLAEVPNPTSDSNSREIATTSWVMQKLGDIGNILDTINGEII